MVCLQAFFNLEDEYRERFEALFEIPNYFHQVHVKEMDFEELILSSSKWTKFENSLKNYHLNLMADKKYKSALDKILTKDFCETHLGKYLHSKCDKGFRFFDSFIESMKLFE